MENETVNGHIFLTFGKVKVEHFVYLVNLHPGRQNIIAVLSTLGNQATAVVLVLNIAKNLFHNIF